MKSRRLLVLVVLMAYLLGGCANSQSPGQPQAKMGCLDLTEWPVLETTASLDGQWEFYPQQLLSPQDINTQEPTYIDVPGSWNNELSSGDGFATYRLLLQTDAGGRLALKLPRVLTAYKLWVNAELLTQSGVVGINRAEMTPQYLPQVSSFELQKGLNEIVVQVSNFYHRSGGILENIIVGPEHLIRQMRETNVAYELFLFGSLAIMGVYHLALYVFRRNNAAPFYIGVFCLLVAIRTVVVGERFLIYLYPSLNWEMMHKIQTLTFYLGVPAIVTFFQQVFPKDFTKKWTRAIQVVSLLFTTLVLFTPAKIFTVVNTWFQVFTFLVIAYMTVVFARLIRRREPGALLIIIGGLALFLTSINDIMFLSIWMNDSGHPLWRSIFKTDNLSSFGQLIFVFANSLVLAERFSQAFEKQETTARQLQEINDNLDQIASERTAALGASRKQIERQKQALEKANQSLRLMTLKDSLTDLWNRRQYDNVIQKEWSRCLRHKQPLALLLIDIDHFKDYNDHYGHIAGDNCLTHVAQVIQSCFERSSDLVARYGGEEFVVIMPEMDKDNALLMANRVQERISSLRIPHESSPICSWVTVSIGVTAKIPSQDESSQDLFQSVDKALYEAKEAGRNQMRFLS